MKATEYFSESEASSVEENVDEVDGPILDVNSWYVKV